ncbi:MAG: hypothetical protein QME81_12955 [bacterium]|nr:hypothetical protein [bacterium]
MIDVKQAVSSAGEFVKNLYDINKLDNLMLEEVAVSDDERYWFVTYGFSNIRLQLKPTESHPLDILETLKIYQPVRTYKVIKVDAETGQARSMKIRET